MEQARELKKTRERNDVFVAIGATDPYNVRPLILSTLLAFPTIGMIHVIGTSASKHKHIHQVPEDDRIKFHLDVDAIEIINLLDISHFAITTSSTVALEVVSCRTPLICGMVADNQMAIHQLLVKNGLGFICRQLVRSKWRKPIGHYQKS